MSLGTPVLAAVDWGTSRFRLWLLAGDGAVLAKSDGDDGLETAREAGFESVLQRHLQGVAAPEALPVLVCGMAGSRQGWVEAPYVEVPAELDAIAQAVVPAPGAGRDVRIVPGLSKRDPAAPDVLRGEETILFGATPEDASGRAQICLPGTHSKWVEMEGRRVADFATQLTGELYALLSDHSILRHSLAGTETAVDPEDPAFLDALRRALDPASHPMSGLFPIRAAALLTGLAPSAASARLSGLLIGAEIAAALPPGPVEPPVTLVASGRIARLYERALAEAGAVATCLDAEVAVCHGLLAIAERTRPTDFAKRSA